jgi:hypothetical protein
MQQWAAWNAAKDNPEYRKGPWGVFGDQIRGNAWIARSYAHAIFLSPDGSPEKGYFTGKLNNTMAAWEGSMDIRNGHFYNDPRYRPMWDMGRAWHGPNALGFPRTSDLSVSCNGTQLATPLPSGGQGTFDIRDAGKFKGAPVLLIDNELLRTCGINGATIHTRSGACTAERGMMGTKAAAHAAGAYAAEYPGDGIDPRKTASVTSPWMVNYLHVALGHLSELGFKIDPYRAAILKNLHGQLTDPSFNPYFAESYRIPVKGRAGCSGKEETFQTWAAVKDAMWLSHATSFESAKNPISGYAHVARAAASYLPGLIPGGETAWKWIDANVGQRHLLNSAPGWALLPRDAAYHQLLLRTPASAAARRAPAVDVPAAGSGRK